jgi:hypothetical protein
MRVLTALALTALLALTGGPARAHTGSYDMKYVDGSNVILLTFNTHQPVTGLDIEHNIRLYDLVGAPIVYDEVHVEVHTQDRGSGVDELEASLRKDVSLPMLPTNESKMTFRYPGPGAYTLTTIFSAGGREISRGGFAIDIGQGSGGSSSWFRSWWLAGAFLLGAGASWLLLRRWPAPPDEPSAPDVTVLDEEQTPVPLGT